MPLIQTWDKTTRRRVGATPLPKQTVVLPAIKGKRKTKRYKRVVLRYCKAGCGALLGAYRHYCDDCTEKKKREAQKKWRDTKRPSQAKPPDELKPHPCSVKTHCPNDHEYTEENTYRNSKGHRKCRKCQRKRQREWRERNRAK